MSDKNGMGMSEPTEASVRAEIRAWLDANWSADSGLVEWRNKLIDSGWGVPSWPKDWFGRELPMALEMVVEEELRRIGAVGVAKTGIRRLAAARPARTPGASYSPSQAPAPISRAQRRVPSSRVTAG